MNKCRAFLFIVVSSALFLVSNQSFAQISNTVSSVNFGNSVEGQPMTVMVELLPISSISDVRIAYRLFEEREFKIREMELVGSSASYTIPGEDVRLPAKGVKHNRRSVFVARNEHGPPAVAAVVPSKPASDLSAECP